MLPSPVPIALGPGITTNAFGVNLATLLNYRHESTSQAVYAQGTYRPAAFDERLRVTLGARYTEDEKHLTQYSPLSRDLTRDFSRFNWSATLDYQWSDTVSSYLRASSAYKAGGFNPRSVNSGFGPEDLVSTELGLKTELFDRRLRLNTAVFYSQYDDMQVQQFLAGSGGASSVTLNAGKAEYAGVEVEASALLTDNLTLNAAIGHTERQYKRFAFRDPLSNQIVDIADTARFQYSAATTGNLGLVYEVADFGPGRLNARIDYNYRSKVYFHPVNPFNEEIADDAVGQLGARVALSEISVGASELTLALWGRNFTDEQYQYAGIDFGTLGFAGVTFGEPRSYGLDISVRL